jgi:zinc finger SWIM domain-containing protein 3
MQIVFFGTGFLLNEKIESYKWLLKTFLKAMGGKAPKLITTDEDASM